MEDETSKKIAELAFEAAIKLKDIHTQKREDILRVEKITIPTEQKTEPKNLKFLNFMSEDHKNDFLRILLKTEFESYSENIYQDLAIVKYGNAESLSESARKNCLDSLQKKLDIANSLMILKADTNGINISNAKQKYKLPSFIKDQIEAEVEKLYRLYGLDLVPMLYEEAKDILNTAFSYPEYDYSVEEVTGTTKWICDNYGVSFSEFMDHFYKSTPPDDVIETFAEENLTICENITLEQIQTVINDLQEGIKRYNKKGRPIKNIQSHAALLVLEKYGLQATNKQLKTAYECLEYWGFIEDEVKKGWTNICNKYPEIQYVKALFKESKKYKLIFAKPLPF